MDEVTKYCTMCGSFTVAELDSEILCEHCLMVWSEPVEMITAKQYLQTQQKTTEVNGD